MGAQAISARRVNRRVCVRRGAGFDLDSMGGLSGVLDDKPELRGGGLDVGLARIGLNLPLERVLGRFLPGLGLCDPLAQIAAPGVPQGDCDDDGRDQKEAKADPQRGKGVRQSHSSRPLTVVDALINMNTMNENWLPIPGYEGRYSISDQGRVKRHAFMSRNRSGAFPLPERLIPATITKGYAVVNLWESNRSKMFKVHRLVALAFLGPSSLTVDHINGEGLDNRLANLRYCSRRENTLFQHADGRVRFVRGEENGKARLTEDKVRLARKLLANDTPISEVGKIVGVAKETIRAMKAGRTWRHVL